MHYFSFFRSQHRLLEDEAISTDAQTWTHFVFTTELEIGMAAFFLQIRINAFL